jgi:hypothetical protein
MPEKHAKDVPRLPMQGQSGRSQTEHVEGAMSEQLPLVSRLALLPHSSAADASQPEDLETLAQLVGQIDDALLVVEHPRLAAQVYAALRSAKAA